mgnify:CR=1 FL=1
MDNPIVLLAVLNVISSTMPEILHEIACLRQGKPCSPFGGSCAISRFVRESGDGSGPLEPFHTRETCEKGLMELARLGLVKKDDAGYRLTYEGIAMTAAVIRRVKKKYGPQAPPLPSAIRKDRPDPPVELSPISRQKLLEELVKQYADEQKH